MKTKNTTYQNLWYMAKMVLTGKFLPINMFKKKPGMFPINNLILQLKNLEKEKSN